MCVLCLYVEPVLRSKGEVRSWIKTGSVLSLYKPLSQSLKQQRLIGPLLILPDTMSSLGDVQNAPDPLSTLCPIWATKRATISCRKRRFRSKVGPFASEDYPQLLSFAKFFRHFWLQRLHKEFFSSIKKVMLINYIISLKFFSVIYSSINTALVCQPRAISHADGSFYSVTRLFSSTVCNNVIAR